jgi:hypothetical protein
VLLFARQAAGQVPAEYTLVVESDDPAVSYDTIAQRLASDLGATVAAPGPSPTRGAITVRYHAQLLVVRVGRAGGAAIERTVQAQGDSEAVRAEAVLLAGNLARDEARELIDELSARQRKPEPVEPSNEAPAEGPRMHATFAAFYPVATNHGQPDVRSPLNLGLFYSHIGRSTAFQMTFFGVSHAKSGIEGAQIGGLAAVSSGTVAGWQSAIGATYASGPTRGAQLSSGFNYAGELTGMQASTGIDIVDKKMTGLQLGTANIAADISGAQIGVINLGGRVKGLQLGVVNIAEEAGEALGLVTIAKDSIHPVVWGSNLAYTNAGIRFSSRHLYSIAALGFGTLETRWDDSPLITVAAGGSLHVFEGLGVDLELAYSHLDAQNNRALHARVIAGYAFAKHLRVVLGIGPRIPLAYDVGSPVVRPEVLAGVQF